MLTKRSFGVFLSIGMAVPALGGGIPAPCATRRARFVPAPPAHTIIESGVFPNAIVLKIRQPSRVRLREGRFLDLDAGTAVTELEDLIGGVDRLERRRLFSRPEEDLEQERLRGEAATCTELGDLNLYYLLVLPEGDPAATEQLIDGLNGLAAVELAYALPVPALADSWESSGAAVPVLHGGADAPANYEPEQAHLDPAPLGIDAEWAWTLPYGRGQGVKYIDLEDQWNLNHDDLGTEFIRLPGGYSVPSPGCSSGNCDFGGYQNHGTACIGIVSALADGVGTTGIASSAQYGILRVVDYSSGFPLVSDAINNAAASIGSGDFLLVEMHAQGPASGTTCTCNCGQFEYVAMEYWQDNFDAIQNATAAGKIIVEPAGNGSMDLDSPIYGNRFDPTLRDSGAIMVGAGDPGTRIRACLSNYGARVDVQGYAWGIVTLGTGNRYPGLPIACGAGNQNCTNSYDQLYTNTFGGTSGASPIVLGAAALMQGVTRSNYGQVLTPAQVRDYLKVGGTPQGAPQSEHIGPLPNLRGAIRAEIETSSANGWYAEVVARGSDDAYCTGVQPTATLPGYATATYLNSQATNAGIYTTAPSTTRFYVDEVEVGSTSWGNIDPGDYACGINQWLGAPVFVKGGRHTVRVAWDADGDVPEWDEGNNWAARQYVWSPWPLTLGNPLLVTAPPDRDTPGYVYYNSDGFELQVPTGSGSWWCATAVMPQSSSDDYDVRLHDDYTGSTQGFGPLLAQSAYGAGRSDFALANGNVLGGVTRFASVLQGSNTPGSSLGVVELDAGPSVGLGVHGTYTLDALEIVDVMEVYLSSSLIGKSVDVLLDNQGAADLGMSFYEAGQAYRGKGDYVPGGYADTYGAGADESFTFTVPSQGYHALAIWKYSSQDLTLASNYTVEIRLTPPNLVPDAPAGWDAAVVARSAPGCTSGSCQVTPTLPGDTFGTYLSYRGRNAGVNDAVGTFRTEYLLDEQPLWFVSESGTFPPGTSFDDLDNGSFSIKGGRHTLSIHIDDNDQILETSDVDNRAYRQLVWSPFVLGNGTAVTRSAPPDRDTPGAGYDNCDGYAYPTGWWGVFAMTPTAATDNYDLRLHGDYTGSQGGFQSVLRSSLLGSGWTDLLVLNSNHPSIPYGSTWYPSVFQASGTPQSGTYRVHHFDSLPYVIPPGVFGPFTIAGNELVGAHELYFPTAGGGYRVTLSNLSGGADLGVAVFDPSQPYFGMLDAFARADAYGAGGNEKLSFTATSGGYYGLVVWKAGAADVPLAASYSFTIDAVLPYRTAAGSTRVEKDPDPGFVKVSWGADCNALVGSDYSIYMGDLATLAAGTYDYSVQTPECNAGTDLWQTFPTPAGDAFFLVVPHDGVAEGSYGSDSAGNERPAAAAGTQCTPQNGASACVP